MTNPLDFKEALEQLIRAGCTSQEIALFCKLRRQYHAETGANAPITDRRLDFVRWLVVTGRLTDQLR